VTVLQQVAQNGTFSYFHKKDLVFLFFPTLWLPRLKKDCIFAIKKNQKYSYYGGKERN
jgi:hypothetical protein